jgi:Uma2 family endonuclease
MSRADLFAANDSFPVGEPVWDIALLFPAQGAWTEEDYLGLDTNRLIEFDNGFVEILPMPTLFHQLIVKFLFTSLDEYVRARKIGDVLFAPLPIRLWPGKLREPDVIYLRPARLSNLHGQPDGADLVMEVVSEGKENRDRDLEIKPKEYAQAGIAEYWIVDPERQEIRVLRLEQSGYREHGIFRIGQIARSDLLPDFQVDVLAALSSGRMITG